MYTVSSCRGKIGEDDLGGSGAEDSDRVEKMFSTTNVFNLVLGEGDLCFEESKRDLVREVKRVSI